MLGHLSVSRRNSLGTLRIKRVNETPALHPCLTSPQSLPSVTFLSFALDTNCPGWTLSSSTNPKCHISKHLRGPSALLWVESSTALSQVPVGPSRPHFRSTSLLHHHGCLSEATRSSSLAPGGTSKLFICHSWTPRAATQGPSLAPAEPLNLWVFLCP